MDMQAATRTVDHLKTFLHLSAVIEDDYVMLYDPVYQVSPADFQPHHIGGNQPLKITSFDQAEEIVTRRLSAGLRPLRQTLTPNFEAFFYAAEACGFDIHSEEKISGFQWSEGDVLFPADNAFSDDVLEVLGGNRLNDNGDELETPEFMYVVVREQDFQRLARYSALVAEEDLGHIAMKTSNWGSLDGGIELANGRLLTMGSRFDPPIFECQSKYEGQVFQFPLENFIRPEWSVVFKYIELNVLDTDLARTLMKAACEGVLSFDCETPSL